MSEETIKFPGGLIDKRTATRAFRGLFLKEIEPRYKHTVEKLRDHLGLESAESTSSAETTAGSLLLVLADHLIRTQKKSGQETETLQDLFSVKDGEAPEVTFNRILEFVIERRQQ